MAALFCVLLLMLLEERLLTQTLMDEALLLLIWLAWAAASIRALIFPSRRLPVREQSMLGCLQTGAAVCGLWLAGRACVRRVMHRGGALPYAPAAVWLVCMVLAYDLLMVCVLHSPC